MAADGKAPIMESAGHGVAFLRQHWRFAFLVAAIGALAQGLSLLLFGPGLMSLVVVLVVAAGAHAALLGAALHGEPGAAARLPGDTGRVGGAMAVVGFFMAIISFMIVYITMSVLLWPSREQVKAAGQDQAQLAEILNRAVESQPGLLFWAPIIGAAILFALTSRLYLAAPASVDQRRVVVFDSWRWTRGNMLRVAAARLLLLAPGLILVFALQTLIAVAFGMPGGDAAALARLAEGSPGRFAIFFAAASFVQIALYSPLEAGLSAYLYRGLRPEATPAP